jgi:hypothetical protein
MVVPSKRRWSGLVEVVEDLVGVVLQPFGAVLEALLGEGG